MYVFYYIIFIFELSTDIFLNFLIRIFLIKGDFIDFFFNYVKIFSFLVLISNYYLYSR